jgi:hypothetical protein
MLPVGDSLLSDMTVVDSIAFGMNVSAERVLSNSPAQTCSFVRTGLALGGFIGAVKAILLTEGMFSGEQGSDCGVNLLHRRSLKMKIEN